MATNIVPYFKDNGRNNVEVYMLGGEGLEASDDGYWVDVSALDDKVLHVTGISGDTVQVFGANTATVPSNATDHIQIGTDITVDGLFEIGGPYKWMKVKFAYNAGDVYAIINARKKR